MNGQFGGGVGSQIDPYIVEDAADLNIGVRSLQVATNNYYFKQSMDIDLSIFTNDTSTDYDGFVPIVLNGSHYDGNNKLLLNMHIVSRTDKAGLFSQLLGDSSVENIQMEAPIIDSQYVGVNAYIGFIAGITESSTASIKNCTVINGKITALNTIGGSGQILNHGQPMYTGGIIGYCAGIVLRCAFRGIIQSHRTVGGVVGYYDNVAGLIGCRAIAEITVSTNDRQNWEYHCGGGIAGTSTSKVSYCVFSGTLQGGLNGCGGIVANGTDIEKCAAYVTIYCRGTASYTSGGLYIGGLAGILSGSLSDSYSLGLVNAMSWHNGSYGGIAGAGGLAGKVVRADRCYTCCDVTGPIDYNVWKYPMLTSGFIGEYVFYNSETYTSYQSGSVNARTSAQLRDIKTYSGFNVLYHMVSVPSNTMGFDGDVVILPVNGVDHGGWSMSETISYVKTNGTWKRYVKRYISITDTTTYPIESILATIPSQEGDRYTGEYKAVTTPSWYGLGNWVYRNGVYVQTYSYTDATYIYDYLDTYRGVSPTRDYKLQNTHYLKIGYNDTGVITNQEFDFTNVWAIDSYMNNGYPFLLGIDYDDILASILGYVRVQANGRIETIPLYSIRDDISGLIVDTPRGKACMHLVDVTDSKASTVRVYVKSGIKSIAKI